MITRVGRKSVTFSIIVTYESNDDDHDHFDDFGKNSASLFSVLLEAPDAVVRQQCFELFNRVSSKSARLFATRKIKRFFDAIPRQPQKIICDQRRNVDWREEKWRKLGQRS